jgi:hypothetical protein
MAPAELAGEDRHLSDASAGSALAEWAADIR